MRPQRYYSTAFKPEENMNCGCGHTKAGHIDNDGPCLAWEYVDGEDGAVIVCTCRKFKES